MHVRLPSHAPCKPIHVDNILQQLSQLRSASIFMVYLGPISDWSYELGHCLQVATAGSKLGT